MSRLNRKVEYALIALKHMGAQPSGTKFTAKEMSLNLNISFDTLSRALQNLCQHEILHAVHGAQGGYVLAHELAQVSLLDVLTAIEGPTEVVRCATGDTGCDLFVSCNVKSPMQKLNQKLEVFYQSVSLSELLTTVPEALSAEVQS
jgi:Rrf2 family nitric oxide-sensitive transcriptional repressor